jgi:hypothetical protein
MNTPDYVVLRHDYEQHCIRLVAGPMSEQEAHARVTELIDGPGIVTYVEDMRAVVLPADGSDIVHSTSSFLNGREPLYATASFLNRLKNQIREVTKTLDGTGIADRESLGAYQVKHEVAILLSELQVHGLLPAGVYLSPPPDGTRSGDAL